MAEIIFVAYEYSLGKLSVYTIQNLRHSGKLYPVKPIFHLATFFVRREAKTRIRQRDWLKLVGEKIRREQVGTVPTYYLSVRANKFGKWKVGLSGITILHINSYRTKLPDL